jgi:hypothetical protein
VDQRPAFHDHSVLGGNPQVKIIGLLFTIFASLIELQEVKSQELVLFRIGWGCIELPKSSQVIEEESPVVDQKYGRIEALGRPKVYWSFGLGEGSPLFQSKDRRIIWRKKETVETRVFEFGLVEEKGVRSLYAVDLGINFRIDSDNQTAHEYLREIAARYKRRDALEQCKSPELQGGNRPQR